VIDISREHGYAVVEACGHINLAEHLFWCGDVAGALASARSAHQQSVRRFSANPLVILSLYYAQLLAHVGELATAAEVLAAVADQALNDPSLELMRDSIEIALGRRSDAEWESVLTRAREHNLGLQPIELAWLRGRCALRSGDFERATNLLASALGEAQARDSGMAGPISEDLEEARRAGRVVIDPAIGA
jgi:hypothetical protein